MKMELLWLTIGLSPLIVVTLGYIIRGACRIADDVGNADGSFTSDYQAFMDSAAARGLTYYEAMGEWDVREAFVRLRRRASDAVRQDPANWQAILDRCRREEIERLSVEAPDLLPAFGSLVKGLSYGDILYPDEARLVDNMPLPIGSVPSIDRRAALRISG